jgi:hypothetical protein
MKIAGITLSVILIIFTSMVLLTPNDIGGIFLVLAIWSLLTPILNALILWRNGTSSIFRVFRIVTIGCNIILLGLTCCILIDRFPGPGERGAFVYIALIALNAVFCVIAIMRRANDTHLDGNLHKQNIPQVGGDFMLLEYALKRDEVLKGYLRAFSCLSSFRNRILSMASAIGAMSLLFGYVGKHQIEIIDLVFAAFLAMGAVVFIPFWLWIRAKTETRHLRIDEIGISTVIGQLTGAIPWARVSIVSDLGDFIFLGSKNMNFFMIPNRAFPKDQDRAVLMEMAKRRIARA